jgi:predicted dienelactone hydrolase
MATLVWRDLAVVHAHSIADAPLSTARQSYPVVILRGGLGALTTQYTTLAEEIASHGYAVVGFDAPYRSGVVVFPDGRVITRPPSLNLETMSEADAERLAARLLDAWVRDIGFVVDRLPSSRFGSRLDLQRVAVAGHSLGGASAVQFCHDDPRCGAAVDIDGRLFGSVVHDGLQRPLMILLSDHNETDPTSRRIKAEIESVYGRVPPDRRAMLALHGANHFTFSDQWLVANPVLVRILRTIGVLGLEPRRGLALTGEAVCRFLDVQLRGNPRLVVR